MSWRIVLWCIIGLLVLLAFGLPWLLLKTLVFPPSPEVIIVIKNDDTEQYFNPKTVDGPATFKVKKGEPVELEIRIYFQRQLQNEGDFNYKWCFEPIIDEDLNDDTCIRNDYSTGFNNDYIPENDGLQTLELTVHHIHDIFEIPQIVIMFQPG